MLINKRRADGAERTRLIDALGHQVVDQHADETIRAAEHELLPPERGTAGIDAREHALRRRLLVSGRAVDLAREEQARDALRLEGVCESMDPALSQRNVERTGGREDARLSSRGSMWSYSTP